VFCGPGRQLGTRRAHYSSLCDSHPFQRHQPANVLGKVLQSDFGFRPRDADRPHDPATRRVLLSTEHVFDAGPALWPGQHGLIAIDGKTARRTIMPEKTIDHWE
jgi:hypothetical protein